MFDNVLKTAEVPSPTENMARNILMVQAIADREMKVTIAKPTEQKEPLDVDAVGKDQSDRHFWNTGILAMPESEARAAFLSLLHPDSFKHLSSIDSTKNLVDQLIKLSTDTGRKIKHIEIAAHGAENGLIGLGDDIEAVGEPDFLIEFRRLRPYLDPKAVIFFSGCWTGAGPDAEAELQRLADATGATVGAEKWPQFFPLFGGIGPTVSRKPLNIGESNSSSVYLPLSSFLSEQ